MTALAWLWLVLAMLAWLNQALQRHVRKHGIENVDRQMTRCWLAVEVAVSSEAMPEHPTADDALEYAFDQGIRVGFMDGMIEARIQIAELVGQSKPADQDARAGILDRLGIPDYAFGRPVEAAS